MTDTEFDDWCDYHFGAFPSVETWLSRMDDKGAATLGHWRKAVDLYNLKDCCAATDELDKDPTDIQFDRHAGMIAALALKYWQRRQPSTKVGAHVEYTPALHASWKATYPQIKDVLMAAKREKEGKALATIEHPGIESHDPPKLDVVELTAAIDSAATDKDLPF